MKYVAILNRTNFDGFYARVFEYPEECNQGPEWYYLNRLDPCGCLEKVFPADIFWNLRTAKESLLCVECKAISHGIRWNVERDFVDHGLHTLTICPTCMKRYKVPL